MTWEDTLQVSDSTWLEDEAARLGNEAAAQEIRSCYDELGAVLEGQLDALSPECQAVLSRDPDGSPLEADASVATFLAEWWWLIGLGFLFYLARRA